MITTYAPRSLATDIDAAHALLTGTDAELPDWLTTSTAPYAARHAVTVIACSPETIAEYETPRWFDGVAVYVLLALLAAFVLVLR